MSTRHQVLAVMTSCVLLLALDCVVSVAAANEPPIAEAGLPRYAAQDAVRLDGGRSYDPDGSGVLSYAWTQVSGPPLVVTGADTAAPTVSGFVQTEAIQECEFELVVNDGQVASPPDTARIVIVPTFTNCTMALENTVFDPEKPTILFFHGGSSEQTGGGRLNAPAWSERANVISFPAYVGDPGTFSGAAANKSYQRPGDRIIVYLSAVAPDYRQPIQAFGWSIGGLLTLDVSLRLNVTYADPRYAVNHACLLDPSAFVMGTPEFQRRVALLLDNPVAGERCWVACYEAVNASVCPSALNVVFAANHALPWDFYRESLVAVEETPFNHGVLAGAYWSILGPGRNLQIASTPGIQTYKFRWIGSAAAGQMEFFDESAHPGRLPEPVVLAAWLNLDDASGNADGAVLTCQPSENAVGYELLFGSDPYRVMDFHLVSDTAFPPMDVVRDVGPEDTWWTIRARDRYGSTIHADPIPLDLATVAPPTVWNVRTGKRYGLIGRAISEAEAGDTILLDPAVYEENIALLMPLTVSSSDPNDPVTVAGTILTRRNNEPTVTLAGSQSAGCVLAGLTIQSRTVGISCQDTVPTIRNCVVPCPDGIAVEFWHGHAPSLIDCTISGQVKEGGDPGLVAYWKLDETEGLIAHDSEGSHDATLMGLPAWQPDGGAVGGALQFNGTSFLVADLVLNPKAGPFTVLAWVKGGAPGQAILSQQSGANWLMADAATGALTTELSNGGRTASSLSSQAIITDGAWHQIAFAWDGVNRRLYVDDVLAAEDTQERLADAAGKLVIGAGDTLTPGTFWSGLIDDVRIYNRIVQP